MTIVWNSLNGQASRVVINMRDCSLRGKTRTEDEYGRVRCRECGGYGGHQSVVTTTYERTPEWDAPTPVKPGEQMRLAV